MKPFALTTVNYDTLIGDALQGERVSFAFSSIPQVSLVPLADGRHDALKTFLSKSVIHVHGLKTDHDGHNGFTLTPDEYNNPDYLVRFVRFYQAMVRPVNAKSRSMVFVGAQATLVDPHFLGLWYVLSRTPSAGGQALPHFVLVCCKGEQSGSIARADGPASVVVGYAHRIYQTYGIVIVPIVYGNRYSDLPKFLQGLA